MSTGLENRLAGMLWIHKNLDGRSDWIGASGLLSRLTPVHQHLKRPQPISLEKRSFVAVGVINYVAVVSGRHVDLRSNDSSRHSIPIVLSLNLYLQEHSDKRKNEPHNDQDSASNR
jgi:hypothetical protein